jgi:hypothetical protein
LPGNHFRRSDLPVGSSRQNLVQPLCKKYFHFFFPEIMLAPRHPAPARGALRPIVTRRGAGCDGCSSVLRRRAQFAYGKIVWSRSPDAGIKRVDFFSRATVAIKPGHRGERVISRKTIAQGRPECFGVPVFARVLSALISRTRGCGCDVHPAFPAPS